MMCYHWIPKFNDYIDEECKLFTRLYDKRDHFDFPVANVSYLGSNIPESPAVD